MKPMLFSHPKRVFNLLILLILPALAAQAQDSDVLLNSELYHFIDRIDIKGMTGRTIHTDIKPYNRAQVQKIFEEAQESVENGEQTMAPRTQQWFDLNRVLGDDDYADSHEGQGIFKGFYKNQRDLYHYREKGLKLYVNPIIYGGLGADMNNYSPTSDTILPNYRNSRGLRVRGSAFGKLGFFTEITENQAKYPQFMRNYADDNFGRLWGEGFVKTFEGNGFDYFSARGYINYSPVQDHVRIKLGKDRAFLGNGYQSLLLSDHATDYLFLNLNTRFWKFEYVNHFAQLINFIPNKPDGFGTHPRKFMVLHQLNFKPRDWVSVGFFESVVYSPTLPGRVRGFELEYLNPIIFYRSVEQFLGSPDNSFMGLTWKFNFLKRFQHYGQLLLDDFNFRQRALGPGYVGNKYGYQMGLKYIDAFWIPRLDLQMEYNRVRPYTYSHFNPAANFTHYGQYLGHAQGANLYDFNFIARYSPFPRWSGTLAYTSMLKGLDVNGVNYGGDPYRPYTTAFQTYNNFVGQGEAFKVTQLYGRLSYRLGGKIKRLANANIHAELEGRYRKENENTSLSVFGTLRVGMPHKWVKY